MSAPLQREDAPPLPANDAPCLLRDFRAERPAAYGSFATGRQPDGSDVDAIVHLARPLGVQSVAPALYPAIGQAGRSAWP